MRILWDAEQDISAHADSGTHVVIEDDAKNKAYSVTVMLGNEVQSHAMIQCPVIRSKSRIRITEYDLMAFHVWAVVKVES